MPAKNGNARRERFGRLQKAFAHYRQAALGGNALIDEFSRAREYFFRVSLFGSHRKSASDPSYIAAHHCAQVLDENDIDVLHGGGPGIMDAAGNGSTDRGNGRKAISISVSMGFVDQGLSGAFDLNLDAADFGDRLKIFYMLSAAAVCFVGGRGTDLERAYFAQRSQKARIAHHVARKAAGITDPSAFLAREQLPSDEYLYGPNPWIRLGFFPKVYMVGRCWGPVQQLDENFETEETIYPEDRPLQVFVESVDEAIAGLLQDRERWRQVLRHYDVEPMN